MSYVETPRTNVNKARLGQPHRSNKPKELARIPKMGHRDPGLVLRLGCRHVPGHARARHPTAVTGAKSHIRELETAARFYLRAELVSRTAFLGTFE